jgi:hypothetical protein
MNSKGSAARLLEVGALVRIIVSRQAARASPFGQLLGSSNTTRAPFACTLPSQRAKILRMTSSMGTSWMSISLTGRSSSRDLHTGITLSRLTLI